MAPASSHWYNDKNERVTSFPKGRKYIYGKCIRIPCACTNVNCQATVDADGVYRARATRRWLNDKNERVTSFPESSGPYVLAVCITRTCHACDEEGNACTTHTPSPLDPSKFVCGTCEYLDLYPDNQTCPFCKTRWARITITPDAMREWIEDAGIAGEWWAKWRTTEELSRAACRGCFEDAANEVILRKKGEIALSKNKERQDSGITREQQAKELVRLIGQLNLNRQRK
jgi:hypothetical protein